MRTAAHQINFRVTDEELAILKMNAERAGFTKVPVYCKRLVLGVKIKPQIIDKEAGKALLPHVAHIGSNINQLARRANEGGTVAAAELAAVKDEFEMLWSYILEGKKPKKQEKQTKQTEEQTQAEQAEVAESSSVEHICPMCGGVAIRKHSEKREKDFWICPNYSKERGHLFEWVE